MLITLTKRQGEPYWIWPYDTPISEAYERCAWKQTYSFRYDEYMRHGVADCLYLAEYLVPSPARDPLVAIYSYLRDNKC